MGAEAVPFPAQPAVITGGLPPGAGEVFPAVTQPPVVEATVGLSPSAAGPGPEQTIVTPSTATAGEGHTPEARPGLWERMRHLGAVAFEAAAGVPPAVRNIAGRFVDVAERVGNDPAVMEHVTRVRRDAPAIGQAAVGFGRALRTELANSRGGGPRAAVGAVVRSVFSRPGREFAGQVAQAAPHVANAARAARTAASVPRPQ